MNKSYTIIRPSDHEGWLDARNGGIGSSEVATILGCNPYQTRYQLWRRKKGLDGPVPENFAMKAGHYLEDAVSRFFADESGAEIIKNSAGDWLAVNNERSFLRVSPDRLYWLPGMKHNADNRGICECKTTQKAIDADNVPSMWFCQLQYQLGVMELNEGALAWLTQGREFGWQRVMADKDFFGYMTEEIEKFWRDYIIGNDEPAAETEGDVLLKYPRHRDGKSATADDDVIARIAELKDLKAKEKEVADAKAAIEGELKVLMADAEFLVNGNGDTIATWKAAKDSERFDAAAFCKAHPAEAAEFTKVVPGSRRFILK